jgi:hypothetical protein
VEWSHQPWNASKLLTHNDIGGSERIEGWTRDWVPSIRLACNWIGSI